MRIAVLSSSVLVVTAAFCPDTTSSSRIFTQRAVKHDSYQTSLSASLITTLRGGADAAKTRGGSFLVGNISEGFKTVLGRSGAAMHRAEDAFRFTDIVPILILSFLSEIILRFISNRIVNTTIRRENPLEFEDTPYLAPLSRLICQVGQLGLLVYTGELFMLFLSGLGVPRLNDKPKLLASFVYGLWAAQKMSQFKSHLIDRALRRSRNQAKLASRKVLYNRFLDGCIYVVMTLLLLDANSIDVGVALASLLTLGGVSSVVVGLALKEPVTEIIQGTSVLLSDKFSTGDVIRLSDGTAGQVQDLRWTDTTIRGNDNSFVRIPHSQLAKSRVINLSRMQFSQVSQELRLPNRGITKIKQLLDDIKKEIRTSCPKLVDDGSQPFRVHWTDIEKENVVISIESHYRIPRLSNEYWDNRQNVLIAISRAVEKYNLAQ